jgi:hypothetical protein
VWLVRSSQLKEEKVMSRSAKSKIGRMADYVPRLEGLGLSKEKVMELLAWLFTSYDSKLGKRCSPERTLVLAAVKKSNNRDDLKDAQSKEDQDRPKIQVVLGVIKEHPTHKEAMIQLVCYLGWKEPEAKRVLMLADARLSAERRRPRRKAMTGHQYHRKAHFCA